MTEKPLSKTAAQKAIRHNSLFDLTERVATLESEMKKLLHLMENGTLFAAGNPKVPTNSKRCNYIIPRSNRRCRRLKIQNKNKQSSFCPTHVLLTTDEEELTEQQRFNAFRLRNPPCSHPEIWLAISRKEEETTELQLQPETLDYHQYLTENEEFHEEFH